MEANQEKREDAKLNKLHLAGRRDFLKTTTGLGLAAILPRTKATALSGTGSAPESNTRYRWTSVREIYADGGHNAWPDICRWRDRYYAVFNAGGQNHGGPHGLCLLSSPDGERWEQVLRTGPQDWGVLPDTTHPTICPKLLPTRDRLILVFYFYTPGKTQIDERHKATLHRRWPELKGTEESFQRWIGHHEVSYRTGITYSQDGRTFRNPKLLLDPGWRVWRPQTFRDRHYLIGYRCHGQSWTITPELEQMIPVADTIEMFESASLFSSSDGLDWSKVSDIAAEDNDETDFDFTAQGRLLAVSRKGASSKLRAGAKAGSRHAIAYVSEPPYQSWRRLPLPAMIQAPAVRRVGQDWIVSGRYIDGDNERPNLKYPDSPHSGHRFGTRMWVLNDQTGAVTQAVTLPSWGDCSYPGIVQTPEGDLLVAYYSHSITTDPHLHVGGGLWPGKLGPCSIYLARVAVESSTA